MLQLIKPGTPQCRNKLCGEGSRLCPTPQACQLPDTDDRPRRCLPGSVEQLRRVLLGGVVVFFAVIGLAHFVARIF